MISTMMSVTVGGFILLQGTKCYQEVQILHQQNKMLAIFNTFKTSALLRLITIGVSCASLGTRFIALQALGMMKSIECIIKICITWVGSMRQPHQPNPNLRWDCLRTIVEFMVMVYAKLSISQRTIVIHRLFALVFEIIACIEILSWMLMQIFANTAIVAFRTNVDRVYERLALTDAAANPDIAVVHPGVLTSASSISLVGITNVALCLLNMISTADTTSRAVANAVDNYAITFRAFMADSIAALELSDDSMIISHSHTFSHSRTVADDAKTLAANLMARVANTENMAIYCAGFVNQLLVAFLTEIHDNSATNPNVAIAAANLAVAGNSVFETVLASINRSSHVIIEELPPDNSSSVQSHFAAETEDSVVEADSATLVG